MKAIAAFLIVSLGLNVVLLVRRPSHGSVASEQPKAATASAKKIPTALPSAPVSSMSDRGTTTPIDYGVLRQTLLAAGMSDQAVDGFIRLAVEIHFGERRNAVGLGGGDSADYWKQPRGGRTPEAELIERQLGDEKHALLKELFGADYETSPQARQRRVGGLSEVTAKKVDQIFADYREMQREIGRLPTANHADFVAKHDLLEKEKRADIERLLSPEELFEFDIRNSVDANVLRGRFAPFQPTEAEFRAAFTLFRQLTEERRKPGPGQVAMLDPELFPALSPERYAAFKAVQDGVISRNDLSRFTTSMGLSPNLTSEIIRIQNIYQDRLKTLASNSSLAPEQQQSQRAHIVGEVAEQLTKLLGPVGFQKYRQSRGQWLEPSVAGQP